MHSSRKQRAGSLLCGGSVGEWVLDVSCHALMRKKTSQRLTVVVVMSHDSRVGRDERKRRSAEGEEWERQRDDECEERISSLGRNNQSLTRESLSLRVYSVLDVEQKLPPLFSSDSHSVSLPMDFKFLPPPSFPVTSRQ